MVDTQIIPCMYTDNWLRTNKLQGQWVGNWLAVIEMDHECTFEHHLVNFVHTFDRERQLRVEDGRTPLRILNRIPYFHDQFNLVDCRYVRILVVPNETESTSEVWLIVIWLLCCLRILLNGKFQILIVNYNLFI